MSPRLRRPPVASERATVYALVVVAHTSQIRGRGRSCPARARSRTGPDKGEIDAELHLSLGGLCSLLS
jgi:hypothetical protein